MNFELSMKKIITNCFIVTFFLYLSIFSYAYSKELCDCYASCIVIQPRNLTPAVKRLVKIKYGYNPDAKMEIDHKLPLSLGGNNSIDNLWPLTYEEHKLKTKNDMMMLFFVRNCFMTIEEAQNEYNK